LSKAESTLAVIEPRTYFLYPGVLEPKMADSTELQRFLKLSTLESPRSRTLDISNMRISLMSRSIFSTARVNASGSLVIAYFGDGLVVGTQGTPWSNKPVVSDTNSKGVF
jgi:hypothetical protein